MPKMATKAADNVFYKARMAAASWNDRLASREGTSELTGIDRTRLATITQGQRTQRRICAFCPKSMKNMNCWTRRICCPLRPMKEECD